MVIDQGEKRTQSVQNGIPPRRVERVTAAVVLGSAADRILAREMDTFRAMHPGLLQQFPKEYVAIRRGELIDHDADQCALYLRVDEKYPDEVILIKQSNPSIEEIYTIRQHLPHE